MSVTAAQLRGVIDIPLNKQDSDLATFLNAAALIRSEDLAGSGLSSERLDFIELYLAAHFACLTIESGGIQASRQGQSSDTYKSIAADLRGLDSTRFGQLVLSYDTSGILQVKMSPLKKAQFQVVKLKSDYPKRTHSRWPS